MTEWNTTTTVLTIGLVMCGAHSVNYGTAFLFRLNFHNASSGRTEDLLPSSFTHLRLTLYSARLCASSEGAYQLPITLLASVVNYSLNCQTTEGHSSTLTVRPDLNSEVRSSSTLKNQSKNGPPRRVAHCVFHPATFALSSSRYACA